MNKSVNRLSLLIMLIMLLMYCSFAVTAADSIVISGLTGDEIEVTVDKLKGLPPVEEDVISVDSGGDEDYYTVKGALFSDLLVELGESKEAVKSIRLIAGDGYSIAVPEEVIQNRDIILAYELDGEPLFENSKPVRVVIPEERAMYWVKNMVEIKVTDMVKKVEYKDLSFLETAVSELDKIDYTYYESVDKAVKVSELIGFMGIESDIKNVSFRASDGFNKTETADIFGNGYIKTSGEYAPMFLSPDIPKGMYVKNLIFIGYGSKAVLSLKEALTVMDKETIDGTSGVKLSDLIGRAGIVKADKYSLEAVDGYSVEVGAADMEDGIAYMDDSGTVRCLFSNLSKQYAVKYLYKITPVK